MSRNFARGTQLVVDLSLLSLAYWLAFLIRFEFAIPIQTAKILFFTWPYVVILQYLMLALVGVPKLSWRYIGMKDVKRLLGASVVATSSLLIVRLIAPHVGGYAKFVTIPFGILVMDFLLAFLFVTGVRVVRRALAERSERVVRARQGGNEMKRTLLIGAGSAGVLVAKEVQQNPGLGMNVVGFVDDDPAKVGAIIQGIKVKGNTASLASLVKTYGVDQAVITIALATSVQIRRIAELCEAISLPVKIIPGLYEILDGKISLSRIREVTIEDLLGRESVVLDVEAIGSFLQGKSVMVTGAGGSIGSELCRQVMRFEPHRLILVERSENALFEIHKELVPGCGEMALVPCLADICDIPRIHSVFETCRPDVIFHAAAHKHVPMMEWNPGEAIKNNIFGTKNIADAANRFGAKAFVMISTDKAVNPASIMGTTKRVAELYIQALSQHSKTTFVAVRFGNVLGSAGSVIPIFKQQIGAGGPVTVTHPDMKRYFMTIPEACQLVMQSATMGSGGEIFVLDMGEPVMIVDLARDLIRLSGFTEEEIGIEFSGVRPGEKLFEELSTDGEGMSKTRHRKIFIGKIQSFSLGRVEEALTRLASVPEHMSRDAIRSVLRVIVPEMSLPEGESEPPPSPHASAAIH